MGRKKSSEDEVVEIPSAKMFLRVTCSECAFFKNAAVHKNSRGEPKPCEELGRPPRADPCRSFVPDPRSLRDEDIRLLQVAGAARRPHAVAAAIVAAKRVTDLGFSPGQRVFWRVLGGDFLSNYASGTVVGATRDLVLVAGDRNCTALVKPNTLIDQAAWRTKLASLLRRDAINDPAGGLRRLSVAGKARLVSFEPGLFSARPERKKRKPREKAAKRVITLR